MMDETLADDLSTLNQNVSSTSIRYRSLNVHYVRQEYIFRKEFSAPTIVSEPVDRQTSILHDFEKEGEEEDQAVQPLRNLLESTPRNVAIVELITSEQRFVHDMQNILKTFIIPMLDTKILTSSHTDALFLNWPSLTRIHEKLSSALMVALQVDGANISLGKILGDYFPELLTEYEVYFRFHPIAMKCFREKLQQCSKFRSFMQKAKGQCYGIGTLGDANILTLPLQRIAKYPFMIDQIFKHTSNDCSDRRALAGSLEKANELRTTINNVLDEEMNRVKFDWLQKHVDCTKINEIIVFNSLTHFGDQRKLIHYSHIHSPSGNRRHFYAMLFNDFFLLTRLKRPVITKLFQILHRTTFRSYRRDEHAGIHRPPAARSTLDWFDAPESAHLDLIVYKKPMMLHEIRNVRMVENDSAAFQFDYRGRQMVFFASSINERLLWTKTMNDAIDYCRRRRLFTSLSRVPESSSLSMVHRPIGKVVIQMITAINLPLSSRPKNGSSCTPYCIIEMNDGQRQTTPVLCDTLNLQWNILFRFSIADLDRDTLTCSIYDRSKYTTDRLLGSIAIPMSLLVDCRSQADDSSSMYSLATSQFSDGSSMNWKRRSFYLQHSSKNSQLSLKYLFHPRD